MERELRELRDELEIVHRLQRILIGQLGQDDLQQRIEAEAEGIGRRIGGAGILLAAVSGAYWRGLRDHRSLSRGGMALIWIRAAESPWRPSSAAISSRN